MSRLTRKSATPNKGKWEGTDIPSVTVVCSLNLVVSCNFETNVHLLSLGRLMLKQEKIRQVRIIFRRKHFPSISFILLGVYTFDLLHKILYCIAMLSVKRLAMCSTRGRSQGMYITFASAVRIRQNPLWPWNPEMLPEIQKRVPVAPK